MQVSCQDIGSWLSKLFDSASIFRMALVFFIILAINAGWKVQKSIESEFDFVEFIKDPLTNRLTTERLGLFVALWTTTIAFAFLLTVDGVDKIYLFLSYGGLWVVSGGAEVLAKRQTFKDLINKSKEPKDGSK